MEITLGFVNSMISLHTFSQMTRWAALMHLNMQWPWIVGELFLLFIGMVIILCRPVREKKVQQPLLKPVSDEEIFDRRLELQEPWRSNGSEIQFLARA